MQERFEGVLAEIFSAFGMDLDTPATKDTPRRFLKALFDSTLGYEGDPRLLTAFPTECRSSTVVALGDGRAIHLVDAIATLRTEGYQIVLSEGAPR